MDEKKMWLGSIGLAGIGLVDSVYLTWVKIANKYALCGPIGDCESVNTSQYSELAGIPIALLGAGAYLVIIGLLLIESRSSFWTEYSPLMILGISLAGSLYSIYLTYIEIAVLHAICPYCVVSAIAIILLLLLTILRLVKSQRIDDDI